MKIGLIGLGIMGFAMSQKLMQAGHQVYGRDLNADMEKRAAESGIRVLSSPADVAAEGGRCARGCGRTIRLS
jgi:6-phosphogluconate dehydrogenase